MMLPLTYVMTAPQAIGMLLAIYCSSVYGGSIPAILINVPGTPQSRPQFSTATPWPRRGRCGGPRLGDHGFLHRRIFPPRVDVPPPSGQRGGQVRSIETFALIVFSMTTIAWVSKGNPFKGLLAGVLGALMATVGVDEMSGTNRFTFDFFALSAGFHIVPILIGLFALSEVFATAGGEAKNIAQTVLKTGFKIAPSGRCSQEDAFARLHLRHLPGHPAGWGHPRSCFLPRARPLLPARSTSGRATEGVAASDRQKRGEAGPVPAMAWAFPATPPPRSCWGPHRARHHPRSAAVQCSPSWSASFSWGCCGQHQMFLAACSRAALHRVLRLPHELVMGWWGAFPGRAYVIRFSMMNHRGRGSPGSGGLLRYPTSPGGHRDRIHFGSPWRSTCARPDPDQHEPLGFFASPIAGLSLPSP